MLVLWVLCIWVLHASVPTLFLLITLHMSCEKPGVLVVTLLCNIIMLVQFFDKLAACSNRKNRQQAAMHAHRHVKVLDHLHPQTHHPPVFLILPVTGVTVANSTTVVSHCDITSWRRNTAPKLKQPLNQRNCCVHWRLAELGDYDMMSFLRYMWCNSSEFL